MRYISIATAISLATTAIAAPTPKDNIDVNGLVGVVAVVLRDAVPDNDLTVDAPELPIHEKRDLVPDAEGEISKLTGKAEDAVSELSDKATALIEGASDDDLVSDAEKEVSKLTDEALALLGLAKRNAAPDENAENN